MIRLKKVFVFVLALALLVNSFTGVMRSNAEDIDTNLPEGLVYTISDNEVKITKYTGSDTELKIPETIEGYPVTNLDSFFLDRCTSLKSLFIPKTVTNINSMTFLYCETLETIIVDKANTTFTSIDGVLYSADLSELIKYPDNRAMSYFIVPDGVNELASSSFMYCYNLNAISIPTSLKIIGDSALYHADITDVYYRGTETEWAAVEIDTTVPQLKDATIHYNCAFSVADDSEIDINSTTGFIKKFGYGRTFADFKGMFDNTSDVRFLDANGNAPEDTSVVGTGFTVELLRDDFVVEKVSVVLSGDTDGDGAVTIADSLVAYNHLRGKDKVDGAYAEAAKASGGDNMSIIDVMTILNMI